MNNNLSAASTLDRINTELPKLLQSLLDCEARLARIERSIAEAEMNELSTRASIEQGEAEARLEGRSVDLDWYKRARFALSRYRSAKVKAHLDRKIAQLEIKEINRKLRDLRRAQSVLNHLTAFLDAMIAKLEDSSLEDDELDEIENFAKDWIRNNAAEAEGLGIKELLGEDDE